MQKRCVRSWQIHVDDVVGLTHTYGCGYAANAPGADVPMRTLQNLARNPNFGGEVLVVGLGCEKLQPELLMPGASAEVAGRAIVRLQDDRFVGFQAMVEAILRRADNRLAVLNRRCRETCPASDLVVGVQCGGSDALSGVTPTRAVGFASDLLVRAGATVMFSEVTEVRDAIHLLAPRALTEEVGRVLVREIQKSQDKHITLYCIVQKYSYEVMSKESRNLGLVKPKQNPE